jgi:hypothetical protein
MHPYQNQVDRMRELVKLWIRASNNGFWIEEVSLTYVLLEVELRLLLTSKAGKQGKPLSPSEVDNAEYLKALADLALKEDFIKHELYNKIISFNNVRRKVIHGLIQGNIKYSELEDICKSSSNIIYDIQSLYLQVTIGPEESVK